VRAGDAGDAADLVAAGLYGRRGGLARIGQELIDEVQRCIRRILRTARLVLDLLILELLILELLILELLILGRLIRELLIRELLVRELLIWELLIRELLVGSLWRDWLARNPLLLSGELLSGELLPRNRCDRHQLAIRIYLESRRNSGLDPTGQPSWSSLSGERPDGCARSQLALYLSRNLPWKLSGLLPAGCSRRGEGDGRQSRLISYPCLQRDRRKSAWALLRLKSDGLERAVG
jgi:hypothetical protein